VIRVSNKFDIRWLIWPSLVYLVCSIALIDHGASITHRFLGTTSDPFAAAWFLGWWPWAISHGLDPFQTNLDWYPVGINIAWTTSMPFLSLLGLPATLLSGPVLAFNLLTIVAPVLSALAVYGVCLRFSKSAFPALIGGYLFGFSPYEMSESIAHLNLDFTCFLPCLLLVAICRIDGKMTQKTSISLITLLLTAQFYTSAEVFATSAMFGSIALILAIWRLSEYRDRVSLLLSDMIIAIPCALLLMSPLLWHMLVLGRSVAIPPGWVYMSSAHLGNLAVTTSSIVLFDDLRSFTDRSWLGSLPQSDITTGLPILFIIGWYFFCGRTNNIVRFLCVMLLIVCIFSLGPQLWFGNRFTLAVMPWYLFTKLPLISSALPVRFALYASLLIALIVSRWMIQFSSMEGMIFRYSLGLFACLMITSAPHPTQAAPYLKFFQPGEMQKALGHDPVVLILPSAYDNSSSFWQMENDYGFTQSQGYLGFPPRRMTYDKAFMDLVFRPSSPLISHDIKVICQESGTRYVVSTPDTSALLTKAMQELHWLSKSYDEVIVYKVPAP
jgi:hypothetical protein